VADEHDLVEPGGVHVADDGLGAPVERHHSKRPRMSPSAREVDRDRRCVDVREEQIPGATVDSATVNKDDGRHITATRRATASLARVSQWGLR
jgi:hypothetical protein